MEVIPGSYVEEKIRGNFQPELKPLPAACLTVIPLGGVGEVGRNLTLIETDDDLVMIDCGLRFGGSQQQPGIDFLLPDLSYIESRVSKLRGVLITHGHEDHIGALPWLLQKIQVPIWCSRFARGLLYRKLEEHGLLKHSELIQFEGGDRIRIGAITAVPFETSHSIADSFGFCLETPVGRIVHSGDFKMSAGSVGGNTTDEHALAGFGNQGVLALISDSTNAQRPGQTPSELEVGPALEKVFRDSPKKVIATCFASNVQRFAQFLQAAESAGRKIACMGRSLNENMRLASDLGLVTAPEGLWIDIERVPSLPPEKVVVLSTGSQGEPMSGLVQLAGGESKKLKIEPGDRLVYSARAIPGNERWVTELYNRFYRAGADVVTERDERVHVSGHGSHDDLSKMLKLVKPKFLLPGHGEERHQAAHRKLAHENGLAQENIFELQVGQRWITDGKKAWVDGQVPCGDILTDGPIYGDGWEQVLKDRRAARDDGVVVCNVAYRRMDARLIEGPTFRLRGIAPQQQQDAIVARLESMLRQALEENDVGDPPDIQAIEEIISVYVKRFFKKKFDRARPVIIPAVLIL